MPGHGYPWCKEAQDSSQGAVDSKGNVRDSSCPCTVNNIVAPLGAIPFSENGWGTHLYYHVYEVMWPGYKVPGAPANFNPTNIAHVPAEDDQFFFKIVNENPYSDILVYMDAPPCRKGEKVNTN